MGTLRSLCNKNDCEAAVTHHTMLFLRHLTNDYIFYFQEVICSYLIHLLFVLRFLILKKKPTLLKLCCGIVVVVSLFVCLIPRIFPSIDPRALKVKNETDGVSRVMWPIIFMLGFVSMLLYLNSKYMICPWSRVRFC